MLCMAFNIHIYYVLNQMCTRFHSVWHFINIFTISWTKCVQVSFFCLSHFHWWQQWQLTIAYWWDEEFIAHNAMAWLINEFILFVVEFILFCNFCVSYRLQGCGVFTRKIIKQSDLHEKPLIVWEVVQKLHQEITWKMSTVVFSGCQKSSMWSYGSNIGRV